MNLQTVHRAVLLTDLVDSAGLNEALGDIEFSRVMVRLEQVIRSLIRENHGREIDKTDGFLIVFEQPLYALAFALSLHEAVAGLTPRQSMLLRMRTGLHYGTLVLRKNSPEDVAEGAKAVDADGLTKIIAARLTALADLGQVLITIRKAAVALEAARSSFNSANSDWATSGLLSALAGLPLASRGRKRLRHRSGDMYGMPKSPATSLIDRPLYYGSSTALRLNSSS